MRTLALWVEENSFCGRKGSEELQVYLPGEITLATLLRPSDAERVEYEGIP